MSALSFFIGEGHGFVFSHSNAQRFFAKKFYFPHIFPKKLYPSSPPSPEKNLLNMFDACLKKNHSCHMTTKLFSWLRRPASSGKIHTLWLFHQTLIFGHLVIPLGHTNCQGNCFLKSRKHLNLGYFRGEWHPKFGENFTTQIFFVKFSFLVKFSNGGMPQ